MLTYTGALGATAAFATWKIAQYGVEAALGAQADTTPASTWWSWHLIVLFAACASGLIDTALRRAIRLQRDQEGLV